MSSPLISFPTLSFPSPLFHLSLSLLPYFPPSLSLSLSLSFSLSLSRQDRSTGPLSLSWQDRSTELPGKTENIHFSHIGSGRILLLLLLSELLLLLLKYVLLIYLVGLCKKIIFTLGQLNTHELHLIVLKYLTTLQSIYTNDSIYMFGANYGFAQSMDCTVAVQTMDPYFVRTIH